MKWFRLLKLIIKIAVPAIITGYTKGKADLKNQKLQKEFDRANSAND